MRVDGKKPDQELDVTTSKTKKAEPKSAPQTIHNVFLLDASGSMRDGYPVSKYNNGVKGINDLLQSVNEDLDNHNTISIMEFDSDYRGQRVEWHTIMSNKKIVSFKGRGANGGTPLNDAIGKAITDVTNQRKAGEKVLITVFTDGEENSSHVYTNSSIKTLIEAGKNNDVTVAFVGTERDTRIAIQSFGLFASNTMSYDGTADGLGATMRAASASRTLYSKKVAKGEDVKENFFTKTVETK